MVMLCYLGISSAGEVALGEVRADDTPITTVIGRDRDIDRREHE
jgi:hypothetical protein